jgi:hypothetical protein
MPTGRNPDRASQVFTVGLPPQGGLQSVIGVDTGHRPNWAVVTAQFVLGQIGIGEDAHPGGLRRPLRDEFPAVHGHSDVFAGTGGIRL